MSYGLNGTVAAFLFVAGVGAYSAIDRGANYTAATGEVFLIDRTCNFTETSREDGKTVARGVTDSCNSTDEWAKVRKTRSKVVSGKAVVHVTYVSPKDHTTQTATLNFDGRDDEFYELKAGDRIAILVANSNPTQIRKA